MADTNPSSHVVVVSSPGMDHVTPLAELTKLLVLRHGFTATIVTFSDLPRSLPPSIYTVQLPPPLLQDLPSGTHIVTRICLTMAHSVSRLREILISHRRTTRLAAVIIDLFGSDFLSMVKELGIPRYLFLTSNYFFLSFMLHLPTLEETTAGQFRDLSEPLRLPGCPPLKGEDFLEPIQERESEACAWAVHLARHCDRFDGILVNSFQALEAGATEFLKKRMNIILLMEGVKVALRVNAGENGVVKREEAAKVVKELMESEEGKEVRQRMQEMKKEVVKAVGKEGSSYKDMKKVVTILKDSIVA